MEPSRGFYWRGGQGSLPMKPFPLPFPLPNQPQQNTIPPVNKLTTILCISTAMLFPPTAQGWSGAGHQVIAAEAYRQLSPAAEELPKGYTKAAKMVAEKQAALAGYRLAEEMGKWVR